MPILTKNYHMHIRKEMRLNRSASPDTFRKQRVFYHSAHSSPEVSPPVTLAWSTALWQLRVCDLKAKGGTRKVGGKKMACTSTFAFCQLSRYCSQSFGASSGSRGKTINRTE